MEDLLSAKEDLLEQISAQACVHEAVRADLELQSADLEAAQQLVMQLQRRGRYLKPKVKKTKDGDDDEQRMLQLEIDCLKLRLRDTERDCELLRRNRRAGDSIISQVIGREEDDPVSDHVGMLEREICKLERNIDLEMLKREEEARKTEEARFKAEEINQKLLEMLWNTNDDANKDWVDLDSVLKSSAETAAALPRLAAALDAERARTNRVRVEVERATRLSLEEEPPVNHISGGEGKPRLRPARSRVSTCREAQRALARAVPAAHCHRDEAAYLGGLAVALLETLRSRELSVDIEARRGRTAGTRLKEVKDRAPAEMWNSIAKDDENAKFDVDDSKGGSDKKLSVRRNPSSEYSVQFGGNLEGDIMDMNSQKKDRPV